MHRVVRKAVGLGEVLVHVLRGGDTVDCGYCLKSLLSSGEDTENSRSLCSVRGSPHVGVI
jgi:hypothetical protein